MKKALLVPLIAGICLLTGCAEAPDQVKENMKDYGVNEQIVLDNVTYCSPAELKHYAGYSDISAQKPHSAR